MNTLNEHLAPIQKELTRLGAELTGAEVKLSSLKAGIDPLPVIHKQRRNFQCLLKQYMALADNAAELMVNFYRLGGPALNAVAQERLHVMYEKGRIIPSDRQYQQGELLSMALFMLTGNRSHVPQDWSFSAVAKLDAQEWRDRIITACQFLLAEIDRRTEPGAVEESVRFFTEWLNAPNKGHTFPMSTPDISLMVEEDGYYFRAKIDKEVFGVLAAGAAFDCELKVTPVPSVPVGDLDTRRKQLVLNTLLSGGLVEKEDAHKVAETLVVVLRELDKNVTDEKAASVQSI